MTKEKVRLAILDMNNAQPNEGLRCIAEIAGTFKKEIDYEIFDVRAKNEIPDTNFDIYICSGGPGSPLEEAPWRKPYIDLMQQLWDINKESAHEKKHVFLICYSFQVMCAHFELGSIEPRKSTSFGVLPVHKTKMGKEDRLLHGLDDPFYAVDSRDWQLIQPRLKVFRDHGATILSLEKIRTHVEYERAIMAVRFSEEFVGTQFHPEADPVGLKEYFMDPSNKQVVIKTYGQRRYNKMMNRIDDMDKIKQTHDNIIPNFITHALNEIKQPVIS
ncbi:MAG: GMP synthase [Bacteroidia bacterium]|nr:GMP synthase [Bacteroidia bacterium]NNM22137.1 GMP synthase [Flavobacteriaceae bacterium]